MTNTCTPFPVSPGGGEQVLSNPWRSSMRSRPHGGEAVASTFVTGAMYVFPSSSMVTSSGKDVLASSSFLRHAFVLSKIKTHIPSWSSESLLKSSFMQGGIIFSASFQTAEPQPLAELMTHFFS